jgi:ribosomal protein S18 acetylase RimI-like enzyme
MSDLDIRIRMATNEDAQLLADLGARTFKQAFGADNNPDDLAAYLASAFGPAIQRAELTDPANVFLIASVGDVPAGYTKLGLAEVTARVPGDRPAEIVRIYADQPWIGCGVGSALMGSALALLSERGHDAAWLSVWERNQRGIAFYQKWGFEAVGRQVFMVGGDAQQDLVMSRRLTAGPTS